MPLSDASGTGLDNVRRDPVEGREGHLDLQEGGPLVGRVEGRCGQRMHHRRQGHVGMRDQGVAQRSRPKGGQVQHQPLRQGRRRIFVRLILRLWGGALITVPADLGLRFGDFDRHVFWPDTRSLNEHVSKARAMLADSGIVTTREDLAWRQRSGRSFSATSGAGCGRRRSPRAISQRLRRSIHIPPERPIGTIAVRQSRCCHLRRLSIPLQFPRRRSWTHVHLRSVRLGEDGRSELPFGPTRKTRREPGSHRQDRGAEIFAGPAAGRTSPFAMVGARASRRSRRWSSRPPGRTRI